MFAPYIIKPEGLRYSSEIHKIFEERGLKVVNYTTIRFSKKLINLLYDNLAPPVKRALQNILLDEFAEFGLVEGKGAPRRLRELCGMETNPMLCEEGTIRRIFGEKKGILLANGYVYWMNVIHRFKNKKEHKIGIRIAHELGLFISRKK